MAPADFATLFLASAVGGALNAILGGGSFVTFPALVFVGVPPIVANATSTVALLPGTIASSVAYRRNMPQREPRRMLVWLISASVAGGLLGAVLLLRTPVSIFVHLVPWLLLFATVLFTFGRRIARRLRRRRNMTGGNKGTFAIAVACQVVIAIYGGYFGGGLGILLLALLSLMGMTNVHAMNGLRTLLGAIINGIAVVWFSSVSAIAWQPAAVMIAGAVGAGYVAAATMKKFDPEKTRIWIALLAWGITAYFFVKTYV